jgi:septal ring factor EnvC (AmiA/AmiB activator)
MLDSVSRRAQEEVDRYDMDEHARDLSFSVRNAVAGVAVAEAGAVGLGALVVAAASTAAVDITGILAASMIAGLGLIILPARKRRAKTEFHKRSEELRVRLTQVMREQFEHELTRSVTRIEDAIAPYTRFVRASQTKLEKLDADLAGIRNELRAMRREIGGEDIAAIPASTSTSSEQPPQLPAMSSAPGPLAGDAPRRG